MDNGRYIVLVPLPDLERSGVGGALRAQAERLREKRQSGHASADEADALRAIDAVLGDADAPDAGAGGPGGAPANSAGTAPEPPLLLKIGDVARLLGVSKPHAYNLVSRGDIPSVRIGRSLRVRRDVLLAWLDEIDPESRAAPGSAPTLSALAPASASTRRTQGGRR